LLSCSALSGRAAADIKMLPGDITLTGPHASQHLLVSAEEGGAVTGVVLGSLTTLANWGGIAVMGIGMAVYK
jgi:hypothetical protein